MSKIICEKEDLVDIADAIRGQTGISEPMTLNEMATTINSLEAVSVVDSELSSTSENPVQNKVVTSKFNEIEQDIANLKANAETWTFTLVDGSTVTKKVVVM